MNESENLKLRDDIVLGAYPPYCQIYLQKLKIPTVNIRENPLGLCQELMIRNQSVLLNKACLQGKLVN